MWKRLMGPLCVAVAGPAWAVDLDDDDAVPLYFAAESVSAEAATVAGEGEERVTYYHLETPPEAAELRTVSGAALDVSRRWYVRADLDGMVFSATPELATRGGGPGSGFASGPGDVAHGGAGRSFAVYGLPIGDYAAGLTYALAIADALAVPAGEGRYAASLELYDSLAGALSRHRPRSPDVFGGERTLVAMVPGVSIEIASGLGIADVAAGFTAFVPESASGTSTDPDNPSAPAVLGRIAVAHRVATEDGQTVHAARGGRPLAAADVIGTVTATIEGDMAFGTFDLRTGTATDRCRATSPAREDAPPGGVVALLPPPGEDAVTARGTAEVAHADEAFGTRHLCVWLAADRPRIPVAVYRATVVVDPPGAGAQTAASGEVGAIKRAGARVEVAYLTIAPGYAQSIVIANRSAITARFAFDEFYAGPGVVVEPMPPAAGLRAVAPHSLLVLPVAETLRIDGPPAAGAPPSVAATLVFIAAADALDVTTVTRNAADGSTDTVVYRAESAVEPAESPAATGETPRRPPGRAR